MLFDPFGRRIDARALGAAAIYAKSEAAAWAETVNPLRGLSIDRAARIYDSARTGAYAELQWLYNEIEEADPILLTCVERRSTALLETEWTVRAADPGKARGYDQALADDQAAFLTLAFADAERGNLNEAIEHLALGFFRGFAHARPVYAEGMGSLDGFDLLDNWNFCRDIHDGTWWWNPDASPVPASNCKPVPRGELVSVVRSRHVDYPALEIAIRRALGDKKYGVFLERYGVPPVIIVMPPDIDKAEEPVYQAAAETVARGGSGTVPAGSAVNYATDARGVNPFETFLRRQQELVVLMATGGILTSLSSPTGIGGGATDAHEKTWRTIVRRDCKLMATPMNRVVCAALLDAAFPGRPHLAYFDFADPQPTADEVFGTAGKAVAAGYRVRQADLEEKSGYTLEAVVRTGNTVFDAPGPGDGKPETGAGGRATERPAPEAQNSTLDTKPGDDPAANKADPLANERKPLAKPLQDLPPVSVAPGGERAMEGILEALAADLEKPVAAALEAIEAGATPEEALDAYDAAAAAALDAEAVAARAEPLAAAMLEAAREGAGADPVANKNPYHDAAGRFTSADRATAGQAAAPGAGPGGAVGRAGDWKTLGLSAGREIVPDAPTPKTRIAEARARLEKGEHVTTPLGTTLEFDEVTREHLYKEKGRKPRQAEEVNRRLQALDQARAAIERPHEIWLDETTGRSTYVRFEAQARGREVINAVDADKAHVYSWHTNATSYDHWRKGRLLYARP